MSDSKEMTCEEFKAFFGRANKREGDQWAMSEDDVKAQVPAFKAHEQKCSACCSWKQLREIEITDFGII